MNDKADYTDKEIIKMLRETIAAQQEEIDRRKLADNVEDLVENYRQSALELEHLKLSHGLLQNNHQLLKESWDRCLVQYQESMENQGEAYKRGLDSLCAEYTYRLRLCHIAMAIASVGYIIIGVGSFFRV